MSTNPMVKEKRRKNKKISTLKGWGRGSSDPERLSEDGHLSRAWTYDDLHIDLPELKIPHPLMQMRDFVMIPLREIWITYADPEPSR